MSTAASWETDFASRAKVLPGAQAPWLAALRRRAMDRFTAAGWPTTQQENWRHTSLTMLEQQEFLTVNGSAASGAAAAVAQQVKQLRQGEPGHWLVFVDGSHAPGLSETGPLPAGVEIAALSALLATSPARLEPYFGDEGDGESSAALNLALAGDGAFICVAQGVAVQDPIHLVFIATQSQSASFPRNILVAENGSRAIVVEHYLGNDSGITLTNAVTRSVIGADANLTHLKLQQEGEQAFHLAAIQVRQARGSVYNSHSMSFGARLARNDIVTRFDGEHCETLFNGLYYVNGRRHVDHHTRIEHAQPRGTSREFYRGILADTAHGVFAGRILVSPGADGTDAVQRSDSLLLSRLAKADTRPELEIYADDVKCAHGATVGQIDDASLFYLRSRGLDEAYARNLLTYAFAAEALGRIETVSLRQRAARAIHALLPGGEVLGELV